MEPSSIIDRFNKWKIFNGIESSYANDTPIDSLVNLSTSIEDEIDSIKKLVLCKEGENHNNFSSWQFQKESYTTVLEARLQHLLMASYLARNKNVDLLKPFHIVVRIVKNTSIIPIVRIEGDFIVLSTYFFRVVDKFWGSHFLLADKGIDFKDEKDAYIISDHILGKSAEKVIRKNFKHANECLSHFVGLVSGLETDPIMFSCNFNADESELGLPVYFPEYIRKANMQVQKEFGQFDGKLELEGTERGIFILTTAFYAILHEYAHILLKHVNNENAISRDFRIEEEADKWALLMYVDYINHYFPLSRHKSMQVLKYILGPFGFFETFFTTELIRYSYHFNNTSEQSKIAGSILELYYRKVQLHIRFSNVFTRDGVFTESEKILSLDIIREFEPISILCIMLISQIVNNNVMSFDEAVQTLQDETKMLLFFGFST